ncbi:hypothetical protein [Ruegeria marina]|uniref:D-galactarate dehydratase n=1 Tax=Ruegeria marina TaxID=639004 RepID=A0A1G7ANQ7_9RHOB|nr:hypothetical protein [Ruegeria marina]SDE16403.1 hypothetical protein SAMN04488239_1158 [Ruegeria marina]
MRYILLISLILVAGCDRVRSTTDKLFSRSEPVVQAETPESGTQAEPEAAPEPVEAAADFQPGWDGARQTIAGLGDPTVPGRWMETSLVSQERNGRVVLRKTGAMANVTLIPVAGDPGAGSRLSLEAMRALLAPIDQLVELDVYSN